MYRSCILRSVLLVSLSIAGVARAECRPYVDGLDDTGVHLIYGWCKLEYAFHGDWRPSRVVGYRGGDYFADTVRTLADCEEQAERTISDSRIKTLRMKFIDPTSCEKTKKFYDSET